MWWVSTQRQYLSSYTIAVPSGKIFSLQSNHENLDLQGSHNVAVISLVSALAYIYIYISIYIRIFIHKTNTDIGTRTKTMRQQHQRHTTTTTTRTSATTTAITTTPATARAAASSAPVVIWAQGGSRRPRDPTAVSGRAPHAPPPPVPSAQTVRPQAWSLHGGAVGPQASSLRRIHHRF